MMGKPTSLSQLLSKHGFRVEHISLNPRLTPLTGSLYDWLQLFARNSFLNDFEDELAESIMREAEEMCKVDMCDAQGKWSVMYTRLRFAAVME
jgi:hypothetical protein